MGLFDRFRKKAPEPPKSDWPKASEPDTMALLLMDRVLPDIQPAAELLKETFGPEAVSDIDRSHPRVPAMTVTVEGIEFWCSYLPMPLPKEEKDIPAVAAHNLFLSPEEREAFCANQSFWVLAQKGGGVSLPEKRRVCWMFSRLCAALMGLEGAVGVSVGGTALLVSRRSYLNHRSQMEHYTWDNGDGYFPVPLWVWLYPTLQEEKPTVETMGLRAFGLPEMGFFNPKLPIEDLLNYLFTMSSRQITQREQFYRDAILIPLTEKIEVVCKQEGDKLYFIGA